MKRAIKRCLFLALGLVLLACRLVNNVTASGKADCEKKGGTWHLEAGKNGEILEYRQIPVYEEGSSCVAGEQLWLVDEITRKEVTSEGTRVCDYKIKFISTSPQAIWIVADKHKADIWQKTDEHEWVVLTRLEPKTPSTSDLDDNDFSSHEWSGYYTVYTDPEATGTTLLTIEKYVGIIDKPDCASLRYDKKYLALVAKAVPPTCPP